MENCCSRTTSTAVFCHFSSAVREEQSSALHVTLKVTQQDGNLVCWFVVTTPSIPGGLLVLILHSPPSAASLIVTSCITYLLFSHKSDQGAWTESWVFMCNRIKVSFEYLCQIWLFSFFLLRSSLTCPHCLKQSNTFDPFLCISLPIPLCQTRWAPLFTVVFCSAASQPRRQILSWRPA